MRALHDSHLVGVGHHGNQHVKEDDDVAHWVTAEHEQSRKPGNMLASSPIHLLLKVLYSRKPTVLELVPGEASDPLKVEVAKVDKAKACPEEGLWRTESWYKKQKNNDKN